MVQNLNPLAACHHLADLKVVDVREPHEFALGHIPEAELVPLATVLAAAASWDRDQALLIVCRSGARSGRAADALTRMGFATVFNLAGGMSTWESERLPVVR